jgi:hypothetical protein
VDVFNKTFFRFAFGFMAIIMLSVAAIVLVSVIDGGHGQSGCAMCAQ